MNTSNGSHGLGFVVTFQQTVLKTQCLFLFKTLMDPLRPLHQFSVASDIQEVATTIIKQLLDLSFCWGAPTMRHIPSEICICQL